MYPAGIMKTAMHPIQNHVSAKFAQIKAAYLEALLHYTFFCIYRNVADFFRLQKVDFLISNARYNSQLYGNSLYILPTTKRFSIIYLVTVYYLYEPYIQLDVSGFFLIFHINRVRRHLISLSTYTFLDQIHWQQKMYAVKEWLEYVGLCISNQT